jgi:hypothetical protein
MMALRLFLASQFLSSEQRSLSASLTVLVAKSIFGPNTASTVLSMHSIFESIATSNITYFSYEQRTEAVPVVICRLRGS